MIHGLSVLRGRVVGIDPKNSHFRFFSSISALVGVGSERKPVQVAEWDGGGGGEEERESKKEGGGRLRNHDDAFPHLGIRSAKCGVEEWAEEKKRTTEVLIHQGLYQREREGERRKVREEHCRRGKGGNQSTS